MLKACSGKTSFRFTCSCMVVVSFKHYTFVCIVSACFRYYILFLLNWLVIDLVLQVSCDSHFEMGCVAFMHRPSYSFAKEEDKLCFFECIGGLLACDLCLPLPRVHFVSMLLNYQPRYICVSAGPMPKCDTSPGLYDSYVRIVLCISIFHLHCIPIVRLIKAPDPCCQETILCAS